MQQQCTPCISHKCSPIIYFYVPAAQTHAFFLALLTVTHGAKSRTRHCSTHATVLHGRADCMLQGWGSGGVDTQVGCIPVVISDSPFCHLVAGETSENLWDERLRAAALSHGDIFIT